MKNRLLPLFVVLATFSARSQVVVGGKSTTSTSAQFEVTTVDTPIGDRYGKSTKGILIPRVELTSTKVYAPIVGEPTNSLLVFNTQTIGDVKPGYYFWLVDRWNRLAVSGETGSGDGKDGKDGKVGVAEGTGAPAPKGSSNYLGDEINIYTDTASGTVYIQKSDGTWTPLNGKNGIDGKNGISGGNGAPGTR